MPTPIQHLLSLPPAMSAFFPTLADRFEGEWFASCDPAGTKLGSGGGVAQMLRDAWTHEAGDADFSTWLESSRKLVLLAGGQSRRLPAYAAMGKILMPVPVMRWSVGQRIDQSLLDLQCADYRRVLELAPPNSRVLVASGDVFLRFPESFPAIPEADIVGFGMQVSPETASHFGVFFCPRHAPSHPAFFLQKPSPETVRDLALEHSYFVDTGLWLLSARAVSFLFDQCGWDGRDFGSEGVARFFELYSGLGPSLGTEPAEKSLSHGLTTAVVPLPDAEFYHFGTTRQMIESVSELQNHARSGSRAQDFLRKPHPDMYVLNSDFAFRSRTNNNRMIWVENCSLPPDFPLATENALTGLPPSDWSFTLSPGDCLDAVPVGDTGWVFRHYGFDDSFSGPLDYAQWMGRPAIDWFLLRGIAPETAGLNLEKDIQESPIFALVEDLDSRWIDWLLAPEPQNSASLREKWINAPRLCARELAEQINLSRLTSQRRAIADKASASLWNNRSSNPFFRLDLLNLAGHFADGGAAVPPLPEHGPETLERMHEAAFIAAVQRRRGLQSQLAEERAFEILADEILGDSRSRPAHPRSTLISDQILWARSPVRLDLAGGWTDTPPYCLKFGGAVVNVATDLNGQAPVQVFVKMCPERRIVIRSIDLGAETVVNSVRDLEGWSSVGEAFSLAKAAFSLAGFHPRFRSDSARELPEILEHFGGGIEVSLLAATPKGSGLGTSSVLAATILGALASAGELGWDHEEIFQRTLALEQLLTSGGGWQDQAGGIYHGVKLVETPPGLLQRPTVKWLPERLFGPVVANRVALLYYTGITRVAKTILQEIVRGMFLNSAPHLDKLAAIGANAQSAYQAIQRGSYEDLCGVIRRSWHLNQALDAGTNPPEVQRILDRVQDFTSASKLLGAGGGGYMLLLAKDESAAARIRSTLESDRPNARARFVDFSLSGNGLQITRS